MVNARVLWGKVNAAVYLAGSLCLRPIAGGAVVAAFILFGQPRETGSCGSNIVSSTVVATFCGHRLDDNEMLDLLILWRGHPGWFQRRESGATGGGASRQFGGGMKGHVSQYSTYGDVSIGFNADFDADTVKIGERVIPLAGINTVLVDDVDDPGARRISSTRWTEPRLPLLGDLNLVLVQRSRELLDYLRCEIPMPVPPSTRPVMPQLPIVTVCEKLKAK
jgi:hypothetical protein